LKPAKNVRRLRKAAGLSQSALAVDAGQHQYLISKITADWNIDKSSLG
jgi:transcriptional regulator with XRE-family HTH domain